LDEPTIAEAARAAVKDAEPMSGNGYKIPMFIGVLEEALRAMA
jgi:xanthine dehydrogenase YagS FAD-binding subunit